MNCVNKAFLDRMLSLLAVGTISMLIFGNSSCTAPKPDSSVHYLFLAHTHIYTKNRQAVDPRLKKLDFTPYELVMHGGDMAQNTTGEPPAKAVLDSVFDLDSPNFLWALGNFDYENPAKAERWTGKPRFYTKHHRGITFVVLDTQDDSCRISGAQKAMLDAVLDTISASSHLVLLQHKLCWLIGKPEMERMLDVSNARLSGKPWSLYQNNFYRDIYPKLVAIQDKGINVLCLAGDIGKRDKKFFYVSPEGISFLAVGLSADTEFPEEDRVLIFDHDPKLRQLTWHFQKLDDLVESAHP